MRATREQTVHLKRWLTANLHNPYPSKRQRLALVIESRLNDEQVKTWFGNARRRLKKEKAKAACGNNSNSLSRVQQKATADSQHLQQAQPHQPLTNAYRMNYQLQPHSQSFDNQGAYYPNTWPIDGVENGPLTTPYNQPGLPQNVYTNPPSGIYHTFPPVDTFFWRSDQQPYGPTGGFMN